MSRLIARLIRLSLCCLSLASHAATPMVEGGSDFSVFLSQDGTVQTVGSDASGQLGLGRTLSSETPISSKISSVRKIVSGFSHNLALKSDGTLWVWGGNSEGQLGDGTNIARSMPQQVTSLTGITAIAAGDYHSVAVLQNGSVRAWGSNRDGQLGDGTLSERKTPVAVSGISGVTKVAAGHDHTVALKSDGTVWAWGGNYWGQLGNGTDTDSKVPVQVVKYSDGTPLSNIVAIAAGHSFSVAIDQSGNIFVWGYLYRNTTSNSTVWLSKAYNNNISPYKAKDVAAGRDHVIVLDQDGDLWAWGGNYYGQLGLGFDSESETVSSITPTWISNLNGITAIAAGQEHSLAVKSDGTVWRWGFTRYKPDTDTYGFYSSPSKVQNTSGGSGVSGGSSHSLALLSSGLLLAWGDNADGQLGDGAMTVTSIVSSPLTALSGITQVSAGNGHALALKSDGTVWSWGLGKNGQLGNNRRANVSKPAKIDSLSGIKRIAAAGSHSLAIKSDGTLWAWGNNYYGQLGNGSDQDTTQPVQVKSKVNGVVQPLTNVVAVCGGDWHSVAIDSSGTVWRWGYDEYDATTDTNYFYDYARKVTTIPASKDVACGSEFTLVLANNDTVWAWGNNYYGQLGDGTDIDSYPDTTSYSLQVSNLTNVTAIAAGSYHSLALKSDGTVWRWGYSRYDATTQTDYYYTGPVQIDGLSQVAGVGAGDWHSLVVKSDGTVLGWGFNWAGQLADGTYEEFRSSPQLAVNSTKNGILDLDTRVANNATCPMVVQADKTGSVDSVTAKFILYVGSQTNCTTTRQRASGGYQVFVAANNPATGYWFLLKGVENGSTLPAPTWTQYLGGPLPVFAANAGAGGLDEHVQATLIDGVDARQLAGYDVYVGYGTDAAEMLAANRVKRIFTLGVDGRPVIRK